MAKKIKKLKISEVSLVDKGAGIGVEVCLSKRKEDSPMTLEEALMMLPEDAKAVVMAALAEADKMKAETPPEEEPKDPPADPKKPEDEEFAKRLDAIAKENVELKKKLDAQLEAVAKRDATDKVAKLDAAIPGAEQAAVGELAYEVTKKLSEDAAKTFWAVLEATAEVSKKLGIRIGHSDPTINGSAMDQLTVIAKKLRTEHPSMTEQQAMVRAYELNPDLYAQARSK